MKKASLFTLLAVILIIGYEGTHPSQGRFLFGQPSREFERIISLAPSITETLFALGVGERVVGVTRYCDYPPQALSKPQVGGYLDPNMEAILALKPDLAIALAGQQRLKQRLESLGIPTLQIQHQTLRDILNSIRTIGIATGSEAKAKSLLTRLKARIEYIKAKTAGLSRPRVLVVMSRSMGSPLKEIFIAGAADPYNEMISIAGGVNAYQGQFIRVPPLSAEGIVHLNPEVIIELVSDPVVQTGWSEKALLQDWAGLPSVAAVQTDRIYFFTDEFDKVPGPRFILTLEKMARVIHPEVNWPAS